MIFAFYIKDEYLDSFNTEDTFRVEKIYSSFYIEQKTYDFNFKPDELRLFKFNITEKNYYENELIYTNAPFSALYSFDGFSYQQINSNFFLYGNLPEKTSSLISTFFIVYNSINFEKEIKLEFIKQNPKKIQYGVLNLTVGNTNEYYFNDDSYIYVHINEPGLFYIKPNVRLFKRLYEGDFEKIQKLEDLKNLSNYRTIPDGNFYSSKNYFILFVESTFYSYLLNITKIDIEEKGSEVNELTFTYFKITKGNTLYFTSKNKKSPYIIKLLSKDKGTVSINNKNYFFEEQKLEVIQLKEDENFEINAIDGNFTFAIKAKISEQMIQYEEVGKTFKLKTESNYKFIVYEIDYTNNYSLFKVGITGKSKTSYSYDFGLLDIDEIEKKVFSDSSSFNLDLSNYYLNNNTDKKFYFVIYFENITETTNISIESLYYLPLPLERNKYIQINGAYYKYNYQESNTFYTFISCPVISLASYKDNIGTGSYNENKQFSEIFTNELPNYLINTFNNRGYAISHNAKEFNEDYYFNSNCYSDLSVIGLNDTHFRLYFSNLFSNSSEIEYNLYISDMNNILKFEPICDFYEYFYLYKNFSKEDKTIEFYSFSLKDMTIIEKNITLCGDNYIDLPYPTKFNILTTNKDFLFKVVGYVPKLNDIKIYDSLYSCLSICHSTCETCSEKTENGESDCLTCDKNSQYKYLFKSGSSPTICTSSCPENYELDDEKNKCIEENNNNIIIKVILIIGIILLIVIIIFKILRIIAKKRRGKQEKVNDDINQGLMPMQ